LRYLRARLPQLDAATAPAMLERLERDRGTVDGVAYDDLLRVPDREYFRRRGVPSFVMVGRDGERFADAESYLRHLTQTLPDGYRATRDFQEFVVALHEVASGAKTAEEASRQMPTLRRVGGVCPCSRAVRWVAEESVELPAGAA
jgi:hypothetical protein